MGVKRDLAARVIALGIPMLAVLTVILAMPWAGVEIFGIRGTVWCLLACAPLTCLCLWIAETCLAGRGEDA